MSMWQSRRSGVRIATAVAAGVIILSGLGALGGCAQPPAVGRVGDTTAETTTPTESSPVGETTETSPAATPGQTAVQPVVPPVKTRARVPVPEAGTTRPVAPPPAPKQEKPAPKAVYYKNCTAARAAGAAPLFIGQPGYRPPLDRDKDGIACE